MGFIGPFSCEECECLDNTSCLCEIFRFGCVLSWVCFDNYYRGVIFGRGYGDHGPFKYPYRARLVKISSSGAILEVISEEFPGYYSLLEGSSGIFQIQYCCEDPGEEECNWVDYGKAKQVGNLVGGSGYVSYFTDQLYDTTPITGNGSGLKVRATIVDGVITSVSLSEGTSLGLGYKVGDIIRINQSGSNNNAQFTILANSLTEIVEIIDYCPIDVCGYYKRIPYDINDYPNYRDIIRLHASTLSNDNSPSGYITELTIDGQNVLTDDNSVPPVWGIDIGPSQSICFCDNYYLVNSGPVIPYYCGSLSKYAYLEKPLPLQQDSFRVYAKNNLGDASITDVPLPCYLRTEYSVVQIDNLPNLQRKTTETFDWDVSDWSFFTQTYNVDYQEYEEEFETDFAGTFFFRTHSAPGLEDGEQLIGNITYTRRMRVNGRYKYSGSSTIYEYENVFEGIYQSEVVLRSYITGSFTLYDYQIRTITPTWSINSTRELPDSFSIFGNYSFPNYSGGATFDLHSGLTSTPRVIYIDLISTNSVRYLCLGDVSDINMSHPYSYLDPPSPFKTYLMIYTFNPSMFAVSSTDTGIVSLSNVTTSKILI